MSTQEAFEEYAIHERFVNVISELVPLEHFVAHPPTLFSYDFVQWLLHTFWRR